MAKKKKNDFAPHIEPKNAQSCDASGCKEEGIYKAPKSRNQLNEYFFLCLEHVREHNKQWDFFAGMGPDEIEAFMQDAVTGHRPTWQRETTIKNPHEALYAAVNEFMRGTHKKTTPAPKLSAKMRKALSLFELDYPYTLTNLKQRYKLLVKAYHPDRNPGDAVTEEKFKAVTVAFTLLKQHISG